MERRHFLFGGVLSSLAALMPMNHKQEKGFYLKRKLILREGLDVETGISQTQSYIDYKKLFALDREFQKKKSLLSVSLEKGDDYSLVTRQFVSEEQRHIWMKRFEEQVLIKPQVVAGLGHRYEIDLYNI